MQLAVAPEATQPALREGRYVCTCLRITECELLNTLSSANIRTLRTSGAPSAPAMAARPATPRSNATLTRAPRTRS